MVTPFDKAIAGAIVQVLVLGLGHVGFNVDAGFLAALDAIVTPLVVYLVPNKPA